MPTNVVKVLGYSKETVIVSLAPPHLEGFIMRFKKDREQTPAGTPF